MRRMQLHNLTPQLGRCQDAVQRKVEPNYILAFSWMSGAQNCGFTSRQQCELTRAGNGGFCIQNPWYQPYPPPQTYAPPIRR